MSYAIVGFGNIGQALAHAFARKNIEVTVASHRPPEAFRICSRGSSNQLATCAASKTFEPPPLLGLNLQSTTAEIVGNDIAPLLCPCKRKIGMWLCDSQCVAVFGQRSSAVVPRHQYPHRGTRDQRIAYMF